MRQSFLKTTRNAIVNAAWRVVGQPPPTTALSLQSWIDSGGCGEIDQLSAGHRLRCPPRSMKGAVDTILPTVLSMPQPQRRWYQAEWNGEEDLVFGAQQLGTLINGRIYSNLGIVVTSDNVQITDYSGGAFKGLVNHSLQYDGWLPKPTKIRGSVAVLASGMAQRNYYHWITEVLPRMGMLQAAGIEPDYYYLPVRYPFHVASLEAVGVDRSRMLKATKYSHIQADRLFVMPTTRMQMEPRNANWLYQIMASQPWSRIEAKQRRNLFIARRARDPRNVVNEAEVMTALSSWNFEKCYLEDLPVQQQIQLFQQADFVVGPHGAGLVNTVFCKRGTRVIEIGTPARPSALFYYIAHHRGLHYCNFYGEAVAHRMDESDIRVDVRALVDSVIELSAGERVAAA